MKWYNDIAVLIPAYNAALSLQKLVERVSTYAPLDKIVVVDDGSTDQTNLVCKENKIVCLSHPYNRGKGASLCTGFNYLLEKGIKWIITMDADCQHSPDELPKFVEISQTSPNIGICIGAREMKWSVMPFERILSNRITSTILSILCRSKIEDSQSGYRLYSSELLKKVKIEYKRFEMETEIIMKAIFLGFPVTFIKIKTLYFQGTSHISHFIDTIRWIIAVKKIWCSRKRIIEEAKRL
ncbi:MAG: glycosyltransferase family 2 protein [Chitinispirillaceae bacterium]|nr:glycosyltransferase family 2 protein [Chitinispirillaceae bacterium]